MRAVVRELNLAAVGLGCAGLGLRLLGFESAGMFLAIAGIVSSAALFAWLMVKTHRSRTGGEDVA